ncbi:MAG: hypothetical protein DMENIID0002_01220 [Rickettsia endosymbiont of Sergentomyia squamirostris]|uniref:Uncharacterized protein n=1 Tax=Candidatus Tisiphia endosymbiont of Sergentomyia squamirostris TaxID=3113639 RepID=A0AAT9G6L7_9RICK
MFIKRKNILKASAISMMFVISFVILTNILVRRCINHEYHQQNLIKLEEYHNIIRSLLVDKFNINYILSSNDISDQISILKEHIRNHVFISKYHIPNSVYGKNDLPYTTLQELLDIVSNQAFKYNITINNHSIISNGVVEFQESVNKQYYINKDLTYNISIQISPNSYYTQQAISRVKQQILLLNIGSVFTILVLCMIVLYLSYRDKKIKFKLNKLEADLTNSMEHSKNILLFHKINEEFTLKCYHYSKSSNNKKSFNISNTVNVEEELGYNSEYFPLPITTLESHNEINYHTIKLTPIILYLQSYYTGYTACYNSNIKLDIVSNIETLEVPFESEIFNQIMVSVLSNILYFNKNTERSRCVKLIFQNNLITFIGEGFSLDQNLAVRYSEKIFNDTANLYILNLGQIFILLKSFKINCQVTKNKYSTTIEIKLDNVPTELNTDTTQKAQIIKMNKYRKLNDLK